MSTVRLKLAAAIFFSLSALLLLSTAFLADKSVAPSQPPSPTTSAPTFPPTDLVSLHSSFFGTSYCRENAIYGTIVAINTVDDMLVRLGPPEKVYKWRQGGPENLLMNYGSKYLYPTKGVNFISPTWHVPNNPTPGMPPEASTNEGSMQSVEEIRVAFECYAPTDVVSYLARFSYDPSYNTSTFSEEYVNWTTP